MKISRQSVLFSCILVALISVLSEAAERDAYLKSIIGSVKVRKGQSPIWKDGRPQMVIREKDAVRTFVESLAEIMTVEGTILKLDENTTLEISTLKEFGGGAQSTKVKILNGTILANVKKLVNTESSFEFETPTAVASIRGTILGLDVTGDQTSIKVYEGEVIVKPHGSAAGVSVTTNQMVTVVKGQKTIKPEMISEKDRNAVMLPDTSHKDTTRAAADSNAAKLKSGAIVDTTHLKPADTTGNKPAVDTSIKTSLSLSVSAPEDNSHVKPGAQIIVAGKVTPATAKVTVAGASAVVTAGGDFKAVVTAGQTSGDFEISIEASSGTQSQSSTRKYTIDAPAQLYLQVSSPTDGQKFGVTVIPVSGTTTPGADVSVSGIKCQVSPSGAFSGRVPIPDEENQLSLEFDAELGSQTQQVVRKITYQPDLTMLITNPQPGLIVNSTSVQVSGQILPSTAELLVYDTKIPISTNGNFMGYVTIPDQEGQVTLNFDVSYQGTTRTDSRTVTYKKAVDQIAPVVSPKSFQNSYTTSVVPFTVVDQTPNDEVTFYKIIDGSRESDIGGPNSSFNLNLEEGIHTYTVYAEDLAKNRSNQVTGTVMYLSQSFIIKIRKPVGDIVIHIPPSSPSGQFTPQYTVQFSIQNANSMDNDTRLIQEVSVKNLATNKTVTQRNLTDLLDVEFDVDLQRGENQIQVTVKDVLNRPFNANCNITVR
jgi:FecR protein